MTPREVKLYEAKFECYLIGSYGPLCAAAGVDIAQLSGVECYALATKIQSAAKHSARVITKGVFEETDYLGALRSMSATELASLRRRIQP
jgi:hypothetical protein